MLKVVSWETIRSLIRNPFTGKVLPFFVLVPTICKIIGLPAQIAGVTPWALVFQFLGASLLILGIVGFYLFSPKVFREDDFHTFKNNKTDSVLKGWFYEALDDRNVMGETRGQSVNEFLMGCGRRPIIHSEVQLAKWTPAERLDQLHSDFMQQEFDEGEIKKAFEYVGKLSEYTRMLRRWVVFLVLVAGYGCLIPWLLGNFNAVLKLIN